jgi:putative flippase GtrA
MLKRRAGMFIAVAALGFAVQVSTIVALTSFAGVPVATATALGVTLAMAHNFAWHERWMWADRRIGRPVIISLMKFVASVGLVSLAGTVVLTTVFVALLQMPIVIGNLLAVWSTAVLNYLLLDRLVFREMKS